MYVHNNHSTGCYWNSTDSQSYKPVVFNWWVRFQWAGGSGCGSVLSQFISSLDGGACLIWLRRRTRSGPPARALGGRREGLMAARAARWQSENDAHPLVGKRWCRIPPSLHWSSVSCVGLRFSFVFQTAGAYRLTGDKRKDGTIVTFTLYYQEGTFSWSLKSLCDWRSPAVL